jgi:drug/metabolite transporter (DMT)-like permease
MLGVVFIWGINFSAVKASLHDFAPLAFNALRFGFATLIILGVLRLRGESLALARRDLLPVFLLGLSGHTLYQVLFINGIARTTAANSSLLMATSPIFVAIYGSLLRIERANRLVWAGVLLSFLGVGLLVLGGDKGLSAAVATIVGDLLVLGAAMMWGAYTTFSKPLLARYSPLKLTALTMVAGTSVLVLVSAPALVHQNWSAISITAWGGLFYSTSMAVAVAYVVWYTSVQRVGSARTAIYSSLTPVVAVMVAWIALGDRMTPLQIMGAVVVLAGVLLTRRGRG